MAYVDGYVLAVPMTNKEKYKKLAEEASVVFKDHGALAIVENWGDEVPDGEITSFPMAVKCKENEIVVFSWVTWPSRDARNAGMKKAMEDPRMKCDEDSMPFDGKRMIFGGFETLVEK